MMSEEELISYHIGRRTGKQGPRHPAGDQARVEKLEIGTGTDSHGNNPEINNGNLNQIIEVASPNGTDKGRKSGGSNCSREKKCEYGEHCYNESLLQRRKKSKKLLKEGKHQDGYSSHLKKERQTI